MESAISKEKAIKKWLRQWKLNAIEKFNPEWVDLWPAITGETAHPATAAVISAPFPVISAKAGIQRTPGAVRESGWR